MRHLRVAGATLLAICASAVLWAPGIRACTTAVVSGRATHDGRPLLWKNRDADDKRNQVVFCDDGKYAYAGVVNGGDRAGLDLWAGVNVRGFAIMNSASYNLEGGEDTRGEGRFMKLALQSCAGLDDFQRLLETAGTEALDVCANFGVIDAEGGAAYFEVGPKGYKRFNANDPAIAPRGYIVRTNYSETGSREEGTGLLRHDRAVALVESLIKGGGLDAGSLMKSVARDVANERLQSFPAEYRKRGPAWAYTGDSICRYDTASLFLARGVRAGEDPRLSFAWIIPSLPLAGAAAPVWPSAGTVPAELGTGEETSPLTAAFGRVKERLYPAERGDLAKYMDLQAYAGGLKPVLAGLLAAEARNAEKVEAALADWGGVFPGPEKVAALQNALAADTLFAVNALLEEPPKGKR